MTKLTPLLEKGDGWHSKFRALNDSDVAGLLADGLGEGWKSLSWIWMSQDVVATDTQAQENQLVDGTI